MLQKLFRNLKKMFAVRSSHHCYIMLNILRFGCSGYNKEECDICNDTKECISLQLEGAQKNAEELAKEMNIDLNLATSPANEK